MAKIILCLFIVCLFKLSKQQQGELADFVGALGEQISEQSGVIERLLESTEEQKIKTNLLEQVNNEQTNEIKRLETDIIEIRDDISQCRGELLDLTGQIESLKVDMDDKNARIYQKVNENDEMVSEMQSKVSELNNVLAKQETDIVSLEQPMTENEDEDIRDCQDILDRGYVKISGVYDIHVDVNGTLQKIQVFCDMSTEGGGWTVFQNRYDGFVDFYRSFTEYEHGFGSVYREFWLGLKWIYYMTKNDTQELRVDITYKDNKKAYEKYSFFSVDPPLSYKLHAYGPSGTAGNGFGYTHNEQAFTSKDKDQDNLSGDNCAVVLHGGYWYQKCNLSNLNGKYKHKNEALADWTKGFYWALKREEGLLASQMKFRKRQLH